jgi:hypothetical protein
MSIYSVLGLQHEDLHCFVVCSRPKHLPVKVRGQERVAVAIDLLPTEAVGVGN